jgi:hypothetical protein
MDLPVFCKSKSEDLKLTYLVRRKREAMRWLVEQNHTSTKVARKSSGKNIKRPSHTDTGVSKKGTARIGPLLIQGLCPQISTCRTNVFRRLLREPSSFYLVFHPAGRFGKIFFPTVATAAWTSKRKIPFPNSSESSTQSKRHRPASVCVLWRHVPHTGCRHCQPSENRTNRGVGRIFQCWRDFCAACFYVCTLLALCVLWKVSASN